MWFIEGHTLLDLVNVIRLYQSKRGDVQIIQNNENFSLHQVANLSIALSEFRRFRVDSDLNRFSKLIPSPSRHQTGQHRTLKQLLFDVAVLCLNVIFVLSLRLPIHESFSDVVNVDISVTLLLFSSSGNLLQQHLGGQHSQKKG